MRQDRGVRRADCSERDQGHAAAVRGGQRQAEGGGASRRWDRQCGSAGGD